jgi:hypothetical protein
VALRTPSAPENEDTAVKRYLLYISMLVDSLLPDIVMSAIAGHDVMIQLKVHILLEHSAKAVYYDEHPDYALYMMTVCEAWSIERKLEKANNNPDAIAQARAHHADMKAKFPVPKGMSEKSFEAIFLEFAGPDDYVWLYAAPRALMHGDPEGMRVLLEQRPDGLQVPHLEYPLEQVNALLVDAARNAFLFCDRFIRRFRPGEEAFEKRVNELHRDSLRLVLKHADGRDDDDMDEVRAELARLDGSL